LIVGTLLAVGVIFGALNSPSDGDRCSGIHTDEPFDPPPPPPPSYPPTPSKAHSRAILLILAFLPGLGHMYLGFIRRGLFYLSAFAFSIFITTQFGIMGAAPFVVLAVFGIVGTVAIAFFESLVIRRDLAHGKEINDQLPAFAKNRVVLTVVGIFVVIPFLVNVLAAMPPFVWVFIIFACVGVTVLGWSKKEK